MSIKLMAVCWERNFDQRSDREVMLVLCDHANDDGICWPSRDLVGWKTDLSKDTLKAAYHRLQASGALKVIGNHDGGRGKVPILRVNPFAVPEKPARKRGEPAPPLSGLKGGSGSEKGGNSLPPEPPVEASLEPPDSPRGHSPSEKPAKALTTLTVDRTREVGFQPSPHQIANWGNGWSRFVYVGANEEPPSAERQYAVLQEIIGAAAGKGGKARYFLAVEDAIKRVEGAGKDPKPASEPELTREERARRRTEGYEWLFGESA